MKNPFDQSVSAEDIRFLPYMMRTLEHAKYAANAINQHEKLVATLRECRSVLCTVDMIYPGRFIMPPSDSFDVLLQEEV